MSASTTAAFFRLEGVLVSTSAVAAAAYMAANRAGFRERAFRFGQAVAAAPIQRFLGQRDRNLSTKVAHLAYRDMSEDRIVVLAEEYVEDMLDDSVLDGGRDLLKRCRDEGHRIVVISECIEQIAKPLVEKLRHVDDFVCNHLEFDDGRATGKLEEPIVGGFETGKWARAYAGEHGLNLQASAAYGHVGSDLLLLSSVGKPCAVNPDSTLRRAAEEADWPTVEYRS